MTGKFTDLCTRCYRLQTRLHAEYDQLKQLSGNELPGSNPYTPGKLHPSNNKTRKLKATKARFDNIYKKYEAVAGDILAILDYFKIPRLAIVTGEIPGELAYEVLVNEKDEVFIKKVRDLQQDPGTPSPFQSPPFNPNVGQRPADVTDLQ